MACARMYSHPYRCDHCGSNWVVKDGKSRGTQTYRRRDCNDRFMPSATVRKYPEKTKQQAVRMYREGTSVSAISRVLDVEMGTIYSWIKKPIRFVSWSRSGLPP